MQIIPYIITALAIIGTVGNSCKKIWGFYIWLCTNAFWCVFNVMHRSYAQAILYAVYFILAIVGIVKWKKGEIKNDSRIKTPQRVFRLCAVRN